MRHSALAATLLAVLTPLTLLTLSSCHRDQPLPRDPAELIGQPAPSLAFTPIQNTDASSLSSLQGRTVVLELWATWCGPCRESLPALTNAFHALGGDPLFLAVNVDARSSDREANARSFLDQHAPTAPAVLDNGRAIGLFAARAIPFTAIIDADGIVRHVHVGVIDPDALVEQALEVRNGTSGSQSR